MLVAGCSTRKNTAGTRFYHALTTRYNVYFNGNEAYKAGLQAQQQGNKDNYMEMLPLYPIGNKETTGIGTSDYERAIEKRKKLFVSILSSDAPYVNQDGHTRTNTKMAGTSGVQSFHTPCMAAIGKSTISERRFPGSCLNLFLYRAPL